MSIEAMLMCGVFNHPVANMVITVPLGYGAWVPPGKFKDGSFLSVENTYSKVFRISAEGDAIWGKAFGVRINDCVIGDDGFIYVLGKDGVVIKIDSDDGSIVAARKVSDTLTFIGCSLIVDGSDIFVLLKKNDSHHYLERLSTSTLDVLQTSVVKQTVFSPDITHDYEVYANKILYHDAQHIYLSLTLFYNNHTILRVDKYQDSQEPGGLVFPHGGWDLIQFAYNDAYLYIMFETSVDKCLVAKLDRYSLAVIKQVKLSTLYGKNSGIALDSFGNLIIYSRDNSTSGTVTKIDSSLTTVEYTFSVSTPSHNSMTSFLGITVDEDDVGFFSVHYDWGKTAKLITFDTAVGLPVGTVNDITLAVAPAPVIEAGTVNFMDTTSDKYTYTGAWLDTPYVYTSIVLEGAVTAIAY